MLLLCFVRWKIVKVIGQGSDAQLELILLKIEEIYFSFTGMR